MTPGFQQMVDYFGAAIAGKLELIGSNSGETSAGAEASQTGAIDATDRGGVLMNPVCTYRVVGNVTLSATLGRAWAATLSGGVMTRSGYMLVGIDVATRMRDFPVVTLRAVANEGANAINLWNVSVPLLGRARAQNMLGAFSGGGELLRADLHAFASPVVPFEKNMPCASDIVHGKIVVGITTGAYEGEGAPAAASGFELIGAPVVGGDVVYRTYEAQAQKPL